MDIAARALSTGINDPATAVQVIDQLHELMRVLAERRLGKACRKDVRGIVRLEWNIPSWDELTGIALNELRLYGEGSIHVMRRLRALVVDLLTVVQESRKPVLQRQLELLCCRQVGRAPEALKEPAIGNSADASPLPVIPGLSEGSIF